MLTRHDILDREQEIRQWVSENITKAEIARRLNCKHDTLDKYLKLFRIEYHGKQGWGKGKTYRNKRYVPYAEYIKTCVVQSDKLRKKLLREGLKEHKCEGCGNTHWNGVLIPLEVHHMDSDKENNSFDNLQLLCPNCHALTDTYRGKNTKTYGGVAK